MINRLSSWSIILNANLSLSSLLGGIGSAFISIISKILTSTGLWRLPEMPSNTDLNYGVSSCFNMRKNWVNLIFMGNCSSSQSACIYLTALASKWFFWHRSLTMFFLTYCSFLNLVRSLCDYVFTPPAGVSFYYWGYILPLRFPAAATNLSRLSSLSFSFFPWPSC